jgi:hypothetical protein
MGVLIEQKKVHSYLAGDFDNAKYKVTSCLPMVGGSLQLLPPLKLVAMI